MHYPPMKTLPVFITAAESESFLIASQKHYLTLPAVSRQIKSLEQDLNCQLFIRGNNKVKLTQKGKLFLDALKPAMTIIGDAKRQLLQSQAHTMTISVLNSISTFCLIPHLSEFYEKNPHTDVRLSTNWALPPTQQHEVDFIIGYGQKSNWPNNKVEFLCHDHLIGVGHADIVTSNDISTLLQTYKPLMIDGVHFRQSDWETWTAFHHIKMPSKEHFTQFGNSAQAIHACLNKVGVLITHELFVRDMINNNQLKIIGEPVQNSDWAYFLIHQNNNLSTEMENLVDWLKKRICENHTI